MIIVAMLSALIGVFLGLLGGGGSILAVPILTYAAGLDAKEAIATSLLVVGTTSLVAVVHHARAGNVEWRTGLVFSATAMVGAFLGGLAAGWFSGTTLLLLFAAMMVATAVAMLRGGVRAAKPRDHAEVPFALVVVEGLVVGGATGLVGAGGGFLVVPALVLLGGMPMHRAIGTSLLVISLKSFAAYAGHASHVNIDFAVAGVVTAAAVAGTFAGAAAAHKVPPSALRKGFGWFVLAMAGYVIWREAGGVIIAFVSTAGGAVVASTIALAMVAWIAIARRGAARAAAR